MVAVVPAAEAAEAGALDPKMQEVAEGVEMVAVPAAPVSLRHLVAEAAAEGHQVALEVPSALVL